MKLADVLVKLLSIVIGILQGRLFADESGEIVEILLGEEATYFETCPFALISYNLILKMNIKKIALTLLMLSIALLVTMSSCKKEEVSNPCDEIDCLNGGTCNEQGECACPEGFSGDACENTIDPCADVQCENGGTCNEQGECECPEGFSGDNCENAAGPCAEVPCENGGTCNDQGVCECPEGFSGEFCENAVDPCDGIQCENGGTCNEQGECECPDGFSGEFCENDVDPCAGIQCENGGTCNEQGECECPDGFSGEFCEINDSGLDVIPPTAVLTSPNVGVQYLAGQNLYFDMTAFDDVELAKWRVRIEPNFEGLPREGWNYAFEDNAISGTAAVCEKIIEIPSSVGAGSHTLTAFVTDAADNVSETLHVEIFLINPADEEAPSISLTAPPDTSAPIVADPGGSDDVYVTGLLEDNLELGLIRVSYEFRDTGLEFTNSDFPFEVELSGHGEELNIGNGSAYYFYQAPTQYGEFNLVFTLYDAYNNVSQQRVAVNVAE